MLLIRVGYTSISTAIIIYNMCPVYVMIAGPYFLKEKLKSIDVAVITISFIGLLLVIGITNIEYKEISGILLSGISGVLYACIVIINKKEHKKVDYNVATFIQMLSATVALIPFIIVEDNIDFAKSINGKVIVLIIILGVLHTGIAYNIYFSTYQKMKSIDIISYSYLEPVFGILLSMIVLGEMLTLKQVVGGVMILGATYVGEYIKLRTPKPIDNLT